MGNSRFFVFVTFSWLFLIQTTYELQNSQIQLLLQLRKHLEYPSQLKIMDSYSYSGDICSLHSTANFSILCHGNSVTELKIKGDRITRVSHFNGHPIPGVTLSRTFSIDSFFTTLTRLTSLKCLSLVSLGIWGNLPDKIHRLYELEFLDLSSNYMFGSIPATISRIIKLQTLIIDGNYCNDTIPDSLFLLSNLSILSFRGNKLKGGIPSSMSRMLRLTDVAFCENKLSGRLPDLSGLTRLRVLDFRDNEFSSELPILPHGLVTILLAKNSFHGTIPKEFGDLRLLQHLDLSENRLSGIPPFSLFSLPNISYLNLASNMLSGSLQKNLTCGSKLGFVDISRNRLVGELPSCLDDRAVRFAGNCLTVDAKQQHKVSYCKELERRKQFSRKTVMFVAAATAGAVLFLGLLLVGILVFVNRFCARRTFERRVPRKVVQDAATNAGVSSEMLANARFVSEVKKLGTQGNPACRLFSFDELKEATKNFDSSMLIGEGSIGKLYKGRLENETYIAIRSLTLLKKHSIQNLKIKLDFLSKLQHPHLVSLLGHCIEEGSGRDDFIADKVFLVYEYMPNGSYRAHLSENCPKKVLNWPDRLAILTGIAKAVHFLHTRVIPGTMNNSLDTNNILLDEHGIAKLSEYGMSILTEETEKLEAKGCSKFSQGTKLEDDVYNFGFILLESLVGSILTGKEDAFLVNEMGCFGSEDGRRNIVDPIVLTTCSQESLSLVVSITRKCISPEPSSRPSFEEVLWNLQYAAQVQTTADADQISDSTP